MVPGPPETVTRFSQSGMVPGPPETVNRFNQSGIVPGLRVHAGGPFRPFNPRPAGPLDFPPPAGGGGGEGRLNYPP